ncbi:polyphosphate kinase 2 family protein [Elioraea thermophila]|uniref:polyphosphate kinase 2 family protein n=1 Tax=Elioraea thermophila TaxID=2185104 RepID=UPI001E288E13|nr:polyphosphate kinase 2 family protein [Elioraea thermophila]
MAKRRAPTRGIDAERRKAMDALLARYRVTSGKGFRLADYDPADTADLALDKKEAQRLLQEGVAWLALEQQKLYAQDRWSVLMILQAMDAAGKDGTIKHVMSGVNPQGVEVASFKAPNAEELDHDFLWRHVKRLPPRGHIGIHNRSWYEEVLVVRVHPELLDRQKLPEAKRTHDIFDRRLAHIAAFERYLADQGVAILKVFLHLSFAEQRKRFLERIEEPEKHWKFSAADIAERAHWHDYQKAYEEAIRATATPHAPWYVVPADHKWFSRLVVASALIVTMDDLDLAYPTLPPEERAKLEEARKALLAETA